MTPKRTSQWAVFAGFAVASLTLSSCDRVSSLTGSDQEKEVKLEVVLPNSFVEGSDTVEMAVLVPEDVAKTHLLQCAGKVYLGLLLDQINQIESEIEERKEFAANNVRSFEFHEYLERSESDMALSEYKTVVEGVDNRVSAVPTAVGLDPDMGRQYAWRYRFHLTAWKRNLFELILDEIEGSIKDGGLDIARVKRMADLMKSGAQTGGLGNIDTVSAAGREIFWRSILDWYVYDLVRGAVGQGFKFDIEQNASGLFLDTSGFVKGTISNEGIVEFSAPVSARYLLVMAKSDDTMVCRIVDAEMGLRVQLPDQVSSLARGQIQAFTGQSSEEATRAQIIDGVSISGVVEKLRVVSNELLVLEEMEEARRDFVERMDSLYDRVKPLIVSEMGLKRRTEANEQELMEARDGLSKAKESLARFEN